MKKIIAIVTILGVVLFCLVGCSKDNAANGSNVAAQISDEDIAVAIMLDTIAIPSISSNLTLEDVLPQMMNVTNISADVSSSGKSAYVMVEGKPYISLLSSYDTVVVTYFVNFDTQACTTTDAKTYIAGREVPLGASAWKGFVQTQVVDMVY